MVIQYKPALVNQLTDECCNVIEDALVALGVEFHKSRKRLFGPCPVHDGDNPAAWNLYPDGDEVRGIWTCRTHHCEKKYKKNFAGFVHGVLCKQANKELPWTVAVDWMLRFLGYKSVKEVQVPDEETLAKRAQANAMRRWNIAPKVVKTTWDRQRIRGTLQIPANYFLERGYQPDILDKYDVGFYQAQQRVLVPVYDPSYKFAVGFAGRSVYEKCNNCGFWHNPQAACPATIEEQVNAAKWKNSRGFEAANFLYNYWFARKFILETSTIILVEGPGDVWRLEEAGIHNSVALFGVDLTEEQLTLIESSWAMNIIVMLDNDEAGKKAAAEIKQKLSRTHRLYFPTFDTKDVGELQTDLITADIQPIFHQIKSFNESIGVKI